MSSDLLDPGTVVLDQRFRVIRHLAGGGMGEVYLAEQVSLGRQVALKVLREDLSSQPGMAERFRREARLLSSVDHPGVVRVIDFGQSSGHSCLVMELVEGQTLHDALADGPLPKERALLLLSQLCEGLAAIHEKGIVHRDLKPENVVLTLGPRGEQARLLDFGIARLAETESPENNLSQVGTVVGTPEYLSPEQAMGQRVDYRSDLYSLGVLAYRILSGYFPLPGPSPRQYLTQHVGTPPVPLAEVAPELEEPLLYDVVMRCLAKSPDKRPPSAAALASTFRAMLEHRAPTAPIPLTQRVNAAPQAVTAPSGRRRDAAGAAPEKDESADPGVGTMISARRAAALPNDAVSPTTPSSPAHIPENEGRSPIEPLIDDVRALERPAPSAPSLSPPPAPLLGREIVQGVREELPADVLEGDPPFLLWTELAAPPSSEGPDAVFRLQADFDRFLLPFARANHGRLAYRRPDGTLLQFERAADAIACAQAVQDKLWRFNRLLPFSRHLRARVVVSLRPSDKRPLKDSTPRILDAATAAHWGDVLITEPVRETLGRRSASVEPFDAPGLFGLYRLVTAPSGAPFGGQDTRGIERRQRRQTALGVGLALLLGLAAAVWAS